MKNSTSILLYGPLAQSITYMYELRAYQILKLQRVQNSAGRLIYMAPKFVHIGLFVKELHWLPAKFRIEFKILSMTYNALREVDSSVDNY